MATTKAQQRAVSKYISNHYEQLSIRMKKGERDRYKAVAAALGVSVNQLFINAVEKLIEDNIDRLSAELAAAPDITEDGE